VLLIYEVTRTLWGFEYRTIAVPTLLNGTVSVYGFSISEYRLFIIAFGMTISAALFAVLDHTITGTVIRAASSNSTMVSCLGIDVGRVRTSVFALGTALAAIGGTIAGPILPIQLEMGFAILIDCFMVVVIGGLGSIRGAIIGAIIIGLVRAYGERVMAGWLDILTYSVFLFVLLVRPQGLFGEQERRA
jgi:branched-chain amino acid transport system permease protein